MSRKHLYPLKRFAALLLIATPISSWAACTDTPPSSVSATLGSVCTASGAAYTAAGDVLISRDPGSKLTFLNSVIGTSTGSTGGVGLFTAYDNGEIVFADDLTISLGLGANSYGLAAGTAGHGVGGTITVNGDLVINMGAGGTTRRAVLSLSTVGAVYLKGHTTITASGGSAQRGFSSETGVIEFNTANIDLSGYSGSFGIRNTTSPGGTVTGHGHTDITVDGIGSAAVTASQGAVFLEATAKLTAGTGGASAIVATGQPVTISGKAELSTASDNTGAVVINSGGNVSLGATSTIDATGSNSLGVVLSGTNNVFTAGFGLALNSSGTGFAYIGSTGTAITLNSATVTAPLLWSADATSATSFTAHDGTYTGASTVASGGGLTVAMDTAAIWKLTANSNLTSLALSGSAKLDASAGSYILTGDLQNSGGVIDLSGTTLTAGQQLTVQGGYHGTGGSLVLDTQLGDSTSPTDLLLINGDTASGTTMLTINNVGGTGALTTGNGILVVQVTGTSAGTFVLSGDYIDVDDYRYTLVKVGNDWYLQSKFNGAGGGGGGNTTAVPLFSPWSWALLLFGMAGLGLSAAARRKAQR